MALRNRINWAVAGSADTPALFMLSPYGVLQPVDSRGIDMGDGSLLNPKRLNGREATYRKLEETPGWLLGCGPNDGDTDIDLYSPFWVIKDLFGEGVGTICEGSDFRLYDDRYPTPHADSHYITGFDHIDPNLMGAVDLTDERLTDKREPRLHAETHSALGEDRLTPFQIGAAPIDHRYPIATNEIRGHVQPDGFTIKVTPQGLIHADPQHIDASKIDSGTIDIARLPKGAIGEIKVVQNNEKRFELTVKEVQNGDTVKVDTTGTMYFIVDDTKLDSEEGYMPYTAYESAFVDWDGVKNKPFEFAAANHAYNHSTSGTDKITPESIDAADRVHGHTVDEVDGAANESHTHTIDDLEGVLAPEDLAAHIKATGTAGSFGHVKVDGDTIISVDGILSVDPSKLSTDTGPHKDTHVIGGNDALSCSDIGAAEIKHKHTAADITGGLPATKHASSHGMFGGDTITPASIDAANVHHTHTQYADANCFQYRTALAFKDHTGQTFGVVSAEDGLLYDAPELVGKKYLKAFWVNRIINYSSPNHLNLEDYIDLDDTNGVMTVKRDVYVNVILTIPRLISKDDPYSFDFCSSALQEVAANSLYMQRYNRYYKARYLFKNPVDATVTPTCSLDWVRTQLDEYVGATIGTMLFNVSDTPQQVLYYNSFELLEEETVCSLNIGWDACRTKNKEFLEHCCTLAESTYIASQNSVFNVIITTNKSCLLSGPVNVVARGSSGVADAAVGEWKYLRQNPLPQGYVPLTGDLYQNASTVYPELTAYLDEHANEVIPEADWQARSAAASGVGGVPFYVYDEAANTLRMPDTREDSPYHGTVGTWEGDAIRKIIATIYPPSQSNGALLIASGSASGAVISKGHANRAVTLASSSTVHPHGQVTFDSSLTVPTASTNHPRRIGLTFAVYAGTIGV